MHKEPRGSAGRVCVIHVNVGPEKAGGARSLVTNVLPNQAGGYHWVIDNVEAIRCANDNELVYGARGGTANELGLHYCIIGQADQSAAEWMDDYSQAAMQLCARQIAADCKAKNIVITRTPGAFIGVCGHADVTRAFNVPGGHTDPGPNFPWDYFLGLCRTLNLTVEDDLPYSEAQLRAIIADEVNKAVLAIERSKEVKQLRIDPVLEVVRSDEYKNIVHDAAT
jgi:hypothetical protein